MKESIFYRSGKYIGNVMGYYQGKKVGRTRAKWLSKAIHRYGKFEDIPQTELSKNMGDQAESFIRLQNVKIMGMTTCHIYESVLGLRPDQFMGAVADFLEGKLVPKSFLMLIDSNPTITDIFRYIEYLDKIPAASMGNALLLSGREKYLI